VILALIALLDAAVETAWDGAPNWRWLSPTALAFLALTVWLVRPNGRFRRRYGAAGAAAWSVGGLLVLVVTSAWLPDGQMHGLRLALQSTSTVLTVVTAMAVLFVAFVLLRRLAAVPPRARLLFRAVVATLAVYATVGFALALVDHVSYPALFRGAAAWTRLPWWLQGPSVGVFGLLPLAILAHLVDLTVHLRVPGAVRRASVHIVLLAAGIALALPAVTRPALPGDRLGSPATAGAKPATSAARSWAIEPTATSSDGAAPADDPTAVAQIADRVDGIVKALEAAEKDIPRDTFDPQAVADAAGNNPGKLFEWVRDNTSWVPYRGALRGTVGVLMDRMGNSVDRSLLLAELLRRSGQTVRLARATLTDAQARDFLAKVRTSRAVSQPPKPPAGQIQAAIAAQAEKYGVNAAELAEGFQSASAESSQFADVLARRVADQTTVLLDAVGNTSTSADDGLAVQAMADHWWVQWSQSGAWTDLDPLLPDAAVAQPSAEPQEIVPLTGADAQATLPDKFCQELEFRVVAERWRAGRLTEQVVLHHMLRPFDLIGENVALLHVPLQWPKTLDLTSLSEAEAAARLRTEVARQPEWLPVLRVGRKTFTQSSIRTNGELNTHPDVGGSGASLGGGGVIGGFGGFLGGGEDAPTDSRAGDGLLTAEWIDYEIRIPGQSPRTVRRELFDLIGPAARKARPGSMPALDSAAIEARGLTLLDRIDSVVQAVRYSPAFLSHQAMQQLATLANSLRSATKGQRADQAAEADAMAIAPLNSSILVSLAAARFDESRLADGVFLDRSNIFNFHAGVRAGKNGELVDHALLDLVVNYVAVRPGSRQDAFRVRVEQGVLDTALEGLLLTNPAGISNVSDLFARAAEQGIRPLMLRAGDARILQGLQVPLDPSERMREALAGGYHLVTPRTPPTAANQPPPIGWWRIDSRSGETVGVMASGFNQGGTEDGVDRTYVPSQFIRIGRKVRGASLMSIYSTFLRVTMAALYQAMYFMNNTLGVDMKTPGFWGWFNRFLLQLKIALTQTYSYRVLGK
jgi:hypothetical protein